MSEEPVGLFRSGMSVGVWTLLEWVSNDSICEKWQAQHARTGEKRIISLNHPREQLEILDLPSGSAENVTIEVNKRSALAPGQRAGHYIFDQPLGLGAISEVWQARAYGSPYNVAVKVCTSKHADRVQSFLRERDLIHKLTTIPSPKGMIPLLSQGELICFGTSHSYFVMSLATRLQTVLDSNWPAHVLYGLVEQYASFLTAWLEAGFFYRDLKLEHLALCAGQPVFIDFNSVEIIDRSNQYYRTAEYLLTTRLARVIRLIFNKASLELPVEIDQIAALNELTEHLQPDTDVRPSELVQLLKAHCADTQVGNNVPGELVTLAKSFEHEMPERALAYINNSLILNQDQHDAFYLQGQIFFRQGNFEQTISSLISALNHNSKLESAFDLLIKARIARKAEAAAIRSFELEFSSDSTERHLPQLNAEEKNLLLSACQPHLQWRSSNGRKALIRGQLPESKVVDVYALSSWEQYFGDLSRGSYRLILDGHVRPWRQRAWHYVFKTIAALDQWFNAQQDHIHLLDVGCASGYLRRIIEGNVSHQDRNKITYWGIDVREEVLHRTVFNHEDIESGALGDNTLSAFISHDVSHGLPFVDNYFDVLTCMGFIKYLPIETGLQLLREIRRVLKPSGKLYLSTTFRADSKGYIEGLSPEEFKHQLTLAGFNITGCYGSLLEENILRNNTELLAQPENQWVNQMRGYYPDELVAAIVAPWFPELASQVTYYCEANCEHDI